MKKRIVSILLAAAMVVSMLPATSFALDTPVEVGDFIIDHGVLNTDFKYENGVLTFIKEADTGSTPYVISNKTPGVATTDHIVIEKGTFLTLNGVNIDVSALPNTAALKAETESIIYIRENSINILKSGENCAGLQNGTNYILIQCEDNHLIPTGNCGCLLATGGRLGAGIGGGSGEAGYGMEFVSGTVIAVGGEGAAGIGNGADADCGTNPDVSLFGLCMGTITATGGDGAQALGAGRNNAHSPNVKIAAIGGGQVSLKDLATNQLIGTYTEANTDVTEAVKGKQQIECTGEKASEPLGLKIEGDAATGYEYKNGCVDFKTPGTTYTISNTSAAQTTDWIRISAPQVKLIFNGVNIGSKEEAVKINALETTIILADGSENRLYGGNGYAAISAEGCAVTIGCAHSKENYHACTATCGMLDIMGGSGAPGLIDVQASSGGTNHEVRFEGGRIKARGTQGIKAEKGIVRATGGTVVIEGTTSSGIVCKEVMLSGGETTVSVLGITKGIDSASVNINGTKKVVVTANTTIGQPFSVEPVLNAVKIEAGSGEWNNTGGTPCTYVIEEPVVLPIYISTAEELKSLADKVNLGDGHSGKTIILKNDIDLSAYNTGAGWTPIGTNSSPFAGVFDGNGKTITGLKIDNQANDYQGLFGVVRGSSDKAKAQVKNLIVKDADINGKGNTGAVVGLYDYNCEMLTGCGMNGGAVKGNVQTGGIVGNSSQSVKGCWSTGKVEGVSNVGGIVGYTNSGADVFNCYSTGNIKGLDVVGGVAGLTNSIVHDCYALGNVRGTAQVGGVVGSNNQGVKNCYAVGGVSGTENVGGIGGAIFSGTDGCVALNWRISAGGLHPKNAVGRILAYGSAPTNSYGWNGDMLLLGNENKALAGSDIVYTNGSLSAHCWSGYTDKNGWISGSGTSLPILSGVGGPQSAELPLWITAEIGSKLEINSTEEFKQFADRVNGGESFSNKRVILNCDIDLSAYQQGEGWVPIGSEKTPFAGLFDGQNHTVTGLKINRPEQNYQGLFGNVAGESDADVAQVKRITVKGAEVKGNENIGTVVGKYGKNVLAMEECAAPDCYVSGNFRVGGLIGNGDSLVDRCYSTGIVTAPSGHAGGIRGDGTGTISNCYSTCDVSGGTNIGGIVGLTGWSVTNCYATGSITGRFNVGSIAGRALDTINNCVGLSPLVYGDIVDGHVGRLASEVRAVNKGYAWAGMKVVGAELCAYKGKDLTCAGGQLSENPWAEFTDAKGWTAGSLNSLPTLKNLGNGQSSTLPDWLTNDVIFIANRDEMMAFAAEVNGGDDFRGKTVRLVADINISDTMLVGGWVPIGQYNSEADNKPFAGVFDGQNHIIRGLRITAFNDNYIGLFGYVAGVLEGGNTAKAQVKNVVLHDATVFGKQFIGGVVGFYGSNTEPLENCAMIGGGVEGFDQCTGGIAGKSEAPVINCAATCTVSGKDNVGGIVGQCTQSVINCYASGNVKGDYSVGGVAGDVTKKVENCYSTGAVSGKDKVAGVAGVAQGGALKCVALNSHLSAETVNNNVGYVVAAGSADQSCYSLSGIPVKGKINSQDNSSDLFIAGKFLHGGTGKFAWSGFDEGIWDISASPAVLPKLKNNIATQPVLSSLQQLGTFDFFGERLLNLDKGMNYSAAGVGVVTVSAASDANGAVAIPADWFGKTVTLTDKDYAVRRITIPSRSVGPAPSCTVTATTITVTAPSSGVQYSLDGKSWSDKAVFTGLNPNTSYTVWVRLNATELSFPSQAATVAATTLVASTISGDTAMTLTVGYAATSTGAYTITGTSAPTVTKTSGNAAITWDPVTKKLNIAAGLGAGIYPVVLEVEDAVEPFVFTLTVLGSSADNGGNKPDDSGQNGQHPKDPSADKNDKPEYSQGNEGKDPNAAGDKNDKPEITAPEKDNKGISPVVVGLSIFGIVALSGIFVWLWLRKKKS